MRFQMPEVARKGPPCTVGEALAALTAEDREAALGALGGPHTGRQIAAAFAACGVRVEASTVNRHRRGDCRCGR